MIDRRGFFAALGAVVVVPFLSTPVKVQSLVAPQCQWIAPVKMYPQPSTFTFWQSHGNMTKEQQDRHLDKMLRDVASML